MAPGLIFGCTLSGGGTSADVHAPVGQPWNQCLEHGMCRVIAGLGPAVGDASALGVGTHKAAAEPVF